MPASNMYKTRRIEIATRHINAGWLCSVSVVLPWLQVLRELYNAAFVRGSSVPLPELINSLLAVPQPCINGPKVNRLQTALLRPASNAIPGTAACSRWGRMRRLTWRASRHQPQ
jgi:hypothetical protein